MYYIHGYDFLKISKNQITDQITNIANRTPIIWMPFAVPLLRPFRSGIRLDLL